MPRARARTLTSLAAAVDADPHVFGSGRSLSECVRQLCELPGIGGWTAEYIAMRELREPDAFPAADIGLRRAMRKHRGRAAKRRGPHGARGTMVAVARVCGATSVDSRSTMSVPPSESEATATLGEIFVFARLHALRGREAVEAAIREVMAHTRAEPGSISYHFYRSIRDARFFCIHSRWRNEAAFERHAGLLGASTCPIRCGLQRP